MAALLRPEVFDNDAVWDRFISFVGYVDDQPVSTTSIVCGGGVIGVYNVATLPGSQRFSRRGGNCGSVRVPSFSSIMSSAIASGARPVACAMAAMLFSGGGS